MANEENIYILMLERDVNEKTAGDMGIKSQRIIVETPADNFSLKSAHALKRRWSEGGHGEIKIGRVIFSDLDQIIPTRSTNDLLLPDDIKLVDIIGRLHEIASESGGGLPIDDNAVVAQMKFELLQWIRTL